MAEHEEIIPGTFWLSDRPGKTVYGRLYLSEDVRLELEGSLTSAMEYQEQTDAAGNVSIMGSMGDEPDAFTVLGELRDRQSKVSLFECTTVGRSGDWFMSEDSAQTVVPAYGLRGDHITEPTGLTGMRAEVLHLGVWSQAPGFEMVVFKDGKCTLTYEEPSEPSVASLSNGAEVQLIFATSVRRPSPTGGGFDRNIGIEVDGFPTASYRDIERLYEVPLSSLLTLCLRRGCPVTRMFMRRDDGPWLEAIAPSLLSAGSEDPEFKPWNHLLMLPDIGLSGVARWLDNVDRLGATPPIVARIVASSSIQLETDLFSLTSVAEGLHQRLFGAAAAPVEKEDAKAIRAATKKALGDSGFSEEHVQAVIDALASISRPSYKKRLAKLREHTLDLVHEVFGNDFKEWSKEVTDCRNDLAHHNIGVITPEATGVYAAVIYSLRWLLLVTLLLETGISRDILREKLTGLQPYRLFIQQAPDMLPSVYGEKSADDSGDGEP